MLHDRARTSCNAAIEAPLNNATEAIMQGNDADVCPCSIKRGRAERVANVAKPKMRPVRNIGIAGDNGRKPVR